MICSTIRAAATCCLLALSGIAQAGVVYTNSLVVEKVTGVVVGANTYDVTFAPDSFDATFSGDAVGALAALNAIILELNSSTAPFVNYGSGVVNQFSVRTDNANGAVTATSYSNVGAWKGYTPGYFGFTAEFAAAVPEPASLAMVGAALSIIVALGLSRRNRSV